MSSGGLPSLRALAGCTRCASESSGVEDGCDMTAPPGLAAATIPTPRGSPCKVYLIRASRGQPASSNGIYNGEANSATEQRARSPAEQSGWRKCVYDRDAYQLCSGHRGGHAAKLISVPI